MLEAGSADDGISSVNLGSVSQSHSARPRSTCVSRNSWNRSDSVSPVTSTTLGTSVRGMLARRPGILAPTTSSSGKPSTSLFAPLLSEGGPRGLADEERIRGVRPGMPASLEGVGAASELRTASSREDMMCMQSR
jgi:hypothetical protein